MFNGSKTYICAAGLALATFAKVMGWIDESVYNLLAGLFGAGGLAALRSGISKV